MKNKHRLHYVWLILAAYGVWFAVLSGLEEVVRGKYWKATLGLVLGIIVWLLLERKHRE